MEDIWQKCAAGTIAIRQCALRGLGHAIRVHRSSAITSTQPGQTSFDWCCRVRRPDSARRNGLSSSSRLFLLLSMSHEHLDSISMHCLCSIPFTCIDAHLHHQQQRHNTNHPAIANISPSRVTESQAMGNGIVGIARCCSACCIRFTDCAYLCTLHTSLHAPLHLRSNKMESVWSVLHHRQK